MRKTTFVNTHTEIRLVKSELGDKNQDKIL